MNNMLMNTDMTKAILDGRKVQTRRMIKFGLYAIENDMNEHCIEVASNYCSMDESEHPEHKSEMIKHAKYQIGETIWVREPARIEKHFANDDETESYTYAKYTSDESIIKIDNIDKKHISKKWFKERQGIPNGCIKEMARIFLKVTNVRVDRLQDINAEDAKSEGIVKSVFGYENYLSAKKSYSSLNNVYCQDRIKRDSVNMNGLGWLQHPITSFATLWNLTTKAPYKWNDNPYVFVYEFERVEKCQS